MCVLVCVGQSILQSCFFFKS